MDLATKRKLFVDYLVQGKSKEDAFVLAGFNVAHKSKKYILGCASKLLQNPKILNLYDEPTRQYKWSMQEAKDKLLYDEPTRQYKWSMQEAKDERLSDELTRQSNWSMQKAKDKLLYVVDKCEKAMSTTKVSDDGTEITVVDSKAISSLISALKELNSLHDLSVAKADNEADTVTIIDDI